MSSPATARWLSPDEATPQQVISLLEAGISVTVSAEISIQNLDELWQAGIVAKISGNRLNKGEIELELERP